MLVPFGEYAPDIADLNASVSSEAMGVIPYLNGYAPFPSFGTTVASDPTAYGVGPLGAFLAIGPGGQRVVFMGSDEKLWRLDSSAAWEDVSQAATTYAATADDRWSFGQFGDFVIAVNPNDDPQVFDLTGGTTFVDLAGSPPRARWVATWGDFFVLLGLTLNQNRVHWSGINDAEEWTPGVGLSDYQDFPTGGDVMGSTSSDAPIIFQETCVRRGEFQPGSPAIFAFDQITEALGAKSGYSIVARDSAAFFLAEDGFYLIDAAGSISPIGFNKINREYLDQVDPGWSSRTVGKLDPVNQRVYFAWKRQASPTQALDRMYVYDFVLQRWAKEATATDGIVEFLQAATPGYTLEGLDAFGTLETLPYSLDSRVWVGGQATLAGLTVTGGLGFFSGDNAEAIITTAEAGSTGTEIQEIRALAPVVDTDSALLSIGRRRTRGVSPSWTDERGVSSRSGKMRTVSRARYQRIRMRIPEGTVWTQAQGVDVVSTLAGAL